LFWRFIALVEQGELDDAEAALAAYAKAGEWDGDEEAAVVVPARQAALAIVRGRFEVAESLIREVAERGSQAGLADTGRLTASLTGQLALLRGAVGDHVAPLLAMARRLPGQFYEATAARVLAETGQADEALLELDRTLPAPFPPVPW
jgi:predicted negative regulator of RcsB-dependent stress response